MAASNPYREHAIGVVERPGLELQSPFADEGTRVLKQGDSFAIFDRRGDIRPAVATAQGLFHGDTRFLSATTLTVAGERPVLLSSTVKEESGLLAVDLTNPDLHLAEGLLPQGSLHLFRAKLLWDGVCYERLRVANYGGEAVRTDLRLDFNVDYADIFEVKGMRRPKRGNYLAPSVDGDVLLGYEGLDGRVRRTRIRVDEPAPSRLASDHVAWHLNLPPHGRINLFVNVVCDTGEHRGAIPTFADALAASKDRMGTLAARSTRITTDHAQFDDWVRRSLTDVHFMATATPEGLYPYAGVPWFSTTFGRDGIITALQMLWVDPAFARGVLAFLAELQAADDVPYQDAEPGKILHEARSGEMAALGEVPFGRYYGSVDAPALFVMLAGAYYERTGDIDFAQRLWPHVERALAWIDGPGDADGDGFVEYHTHTENGLAHQGWKDSADPVWHADGSFAEPPIALCEVQGYTFAAKRAAAQLANALGQPDIARDLLREASDLRRRFDAAFWMPEIDCYALALDANKDPCVVRSSNAGHCLWTGIAYSHRAAPLANTLMGDAMFSGFGIRTIAASEKRFNPMSYHNGSVWPHDNAVIALGLSRYGFQREAIAITDGIFHAALASDLHRLPELFCGFSRRTDQGPTLYPVACSPQAWAAGSVFMLLQACLGLELDAESATVTFAHPRLPPFVSILSLGGLAVAEGSVDVTLRRHPGDDVGLSVARRTGDMDVVVLH